MRETYEAVRAAHQELYEQIISEFKRIQKQSPDQSDLVDIALFCRESSILCDDLRKEFNRLRTLCENIACARWALNGSSENLRGKYATASPDVGQEATVPKPGTPEYRNLLRYIGVPDSVIEQSIIKISYDEFAALLKRHAEEGKIVPRNITAGEIRTTYKLGMRKTKEFNEI